MQPPAALTRHSRVLVRASNWLGDAVLGLPAVQRLRAWLDFAVPLTVLTPAKNAAFWRAVPAVQDILIADPNPVITADTLRRAGPFDAAILFPNSFRAALEAFLAGIPSRIGYPGHQRRLLLTHACPPPAPSLDISHQSLHYLRLVEFCGVVAGPLAHRLMPLPKPGQPPFPRRYLALCPGAEYGPAKRWLPESFAAAAAHLSETRGWDIVLLGADGDRPAAAAVQRRLPSPALDLCGRTSLEEFLRAIAHARFVLCNDSGAMHAAAAFGTPAAAVFGSTEPLLTGPLNPCVRVLRHHVSCSPCFLRECPLDFRCMHNVSFQEVCHAVPAMLY